MANWIGTAVSVNCGEPLGCYQGTILEADGHAITLTKAFRNGFPYPKSQVTLKAADIKDLKIIEAKTDDSKRTHSTVPVSKSNKKSHRATVCENLQANQSNTGSQAASAGVKGGGGAGAGGARPPRSKPIDIQPPRSAKTSAGGHGGSGSTPKARGAGVGAGAGAERARLRNEACFGEGASPPAGDDFDFEGNLALFDRAALRLRLARRPDVVPAAPAPPPAPAPLRLPAGLRAPRDYLTDAGARLPAATPALRARLWAALGALGLEAAAVALLARAAADLALRLAGGARRLEARGAPLAAVAVTGGAGPGAAAALLAARLLQAHGARAAALLPEGETEAAVARELAAAAAADVAVLAPGAPAPRPDVLLLGGEPDAAAAAWAAAAGGAALAVEPAPAGWAGVAVRAAVVALAPAPLGPALGRQFLANVAPPPAIFAAEGAHYEPPFGASSLLPLHPADD